MEEPDTRRVAPPTLTPELLAVMPAQAQQRLKVRRGVGKELQVFRTKGAGPLPGLYEVVPAAVRYARRWHRWSQEQVAQKLDTLRPRISRMENDGAYVNETMARLLAETLLADADRWRELVAEVEINQQSA